MTLGYLVRRLLAVILVLIVVTFAVFAITMILPGNAAVMILGEYGTDEAVAALERRLGLDKSWYIQYFGWVKGILSGDLGQSLRLSLPVADVVGDAFLNSASLAGIALISVTIIAIPLGVLAAIKRGTVADLVIGVFSYIGASMPEFVTATLLLLFLAGPALGLLPAGGFVALTESVGGFASHVILPATTLSLILTAHISRQVRSGDVGSSFQRLHQGRTFERVARTSCHPPPRVTKFAGSSSGSYITGCRLPSRRHNCRRGNFCLARARALIDICA